MINKYYTPDITEFKVGFKYEYYSDYAKIWKSYILKLDDYKSTQMSESWFIEEVLELKNIRVKHLDKEDIESLGWELITEQIKDYSHWCFFKFNQVELHVQLNNKYFPRKLNINDKHHQIGNLHIDCKNYNELQIIMKQLNIQQDAK